MKQDVVYVCEIENDIDDMIAAEYLHRQGRLKYIVLDNIVSSPRVEVLKKLGIRFEDDIEPAEDYVFCGGAFTKVANYLRYYKLTAFVANGGFAGDNIVAEPLPKFKGKRVVRTFNLNLDVRAAINVFNSRSIKLIRLVSKNVCHSPWNTYGALHKDNFIKHYHLRPGKCLHDLLMVKEGLRLIDRLPDICNYENIKPYTKDQGIYTSWGSIPDPTSHITISTEFR